MCRRVEVESDVFMGRCTSDVYRGRSRARCGHGKGVHVMCRGGEVEPGVFMGRGYI